MEGYIYLFRRTIDNFPVYVGKCNGKRKDYFTSSLRLNTLLNIHGQFWIEDNYKREIVHKRISSHKELSELEIKYIKEYNTYIGDNPNGYNYSRGGDNWSSHPNKVLLRKKCADGYKKTIAKNPEILLKRIEKFKKTIKDNPNIMLSVTEKRKETLKGNPSIIEGMKVKLNKYRKENPELVKETGRKISKSHLSKSILICPHCYHESRGRGAMKRFHFDNCDPIIQLTLSGDFVAQFSSMTKASKETRTNISGIESVVNHKLQKTAGGFKWMRKSEYKAIK